ncbi:WXG100 family type VII secretion target [Haloechinothrix sp. YIM 98757]|uniref:ESAT-6-like protein n=1 Tax=Haloechinothrix aidingensis TaxID=2752311 RepID=A0A838A506_9PSEU|nr:WXG100 family type VII secretion target [Haloechinothrix aidingensis]MBA0124760.1 WXG100 family type VII secretion target [Haloechinothrix aidingensis]
MPAEMKVHYETLFNASSEVEMASKAMTEASDNLKNDLNPLVSTWSGEAEQNYAKLQSEWDTAHAELNQVLAQIATALQRIGEGYRDMEGHQAKKFLG